MKRNHGITLTTLAILAGCSAAAQAITTLEVELGPAIVNGNEAQMEVTFAFFDTESSDTALTYFHLDVSQSSPGLTAGGTDFSRFTFTPSALLANWGLDPNLVFSPILDFTSGPLYILGVDTSLFPNDGLASFVPHQIGTLNVLLDGLLAGDYLVDIEFSDVANFEGTLGAFQEPLDLQNPGLGLDTDSELPVDEVTFSDGGTSRFNVVDQAPAIPEPATMALGLFGFVALAGRRARS